MVDKRAICGARNNADWYEAVFSVHGLSYRRSAGAFVADDVPLPYYSDLTVVSPDNPASIVSELAALACRSDRAVTLKDSFFQLDLAGNGFETLFEASWIWRAHRQVEFPPGWEIVKDTSGLALWEKGWKRNGSPTDQQMFPDKFLDRDDIAFIGRRVGDRFESGCIANRSADCLGLSNVFSEAPSPIVFSQAADAATTIAGDLPVVGYESGAELEFAAQAGFDAVGALRVLVARNARF